MKIWIAAAAVLSLMAFAGCGDDKEEPASATSTPEAAATPAGTYTPGEISKDLKKEPEVPQPEGTPPTELVVEDIVKGDGKKAKSGDKIAVQYTGVSFSTGEKFDASWDRGAQPFEFGLGAGQVIPGWDQGVAGMRVGGRRLLVIPPDLGYGAQGSPPVIAPNETLLFVVDLVKVG